MNTIIPKLSTEFQRRVHLGDGFSCDLFVFRRPFHGQYQEVRILHAGRILPAAWPQMLKVQDYMNNEDFLRHEYLRGRQHIEASFSVDIALIGCLTCDVMDIDKVVTGLEQNHGIFREWDALVYFIDDKVPKKVFEILGYSGVASQYEFANDAIHLIYAHLRRRYDVISRRGSYVTLDRLLTESLDKVAKPKSDKETLGSKVGRVTDILKKHLPDTEVETVIKCLDFLLKTRNWNAHPNENYAFERRREAWKSVRSEVTRRGYKISRAHDPRRPKPKTADEQDRHDVMKDFLVLTYRIKDWFDEYVKVTGCQTAPAQHV